MMPTKRGGDPSASDTVGQDKLTKNNSKAKQSKLSTKLENKLCHNGTIIEQVQGGHAGQGSP